MGLPYIGGEPFCFELLDGIYQSPFILPAFLYSIGLQSLSFFLFDSGAFPTGDSEWRLAVVEIFLFGLFICFKDKGAREHSPIQTVGIGNACIVNALLYTCCKRTVITMFDLARYFRLNVAYLHIFVSVVIMFGHGIGHDLGHEQLTTFEPFTRRNGGSLVRP